VSIILELHHEESFGGQDTASLNSLRGPGENIRKLLSNISESSSEVSEIHIVGLFGSIGCFGGFEVGYRLEFLLGAKVAGGSLRQLRSRQEPS
jgi:hypothetical protein